MFNYLKSIYLFNTTNFDKNDILKKIDRLGNYYLEEKNYDKAIEVFMKGYYLKSKEHTYKLCNIILIKVGFIIYQGTNNIPSNILTNL